MNFRRIVETSSSLKELHLRLLNFVEDIPAKEFEALRDQPKILAFRAQLNDSIRIRSVPTLSLDLIHALCSIIDQCEDNDEAVNLCVALLQHIGSEVEMYTQAVAVDPDQRIYQAGYLRPVKAETSI